MDLFAYDKEPLCDCKGDESVAKTIQWSRSKQIDNIFWCWCNVNYFRIDLRIRSMRLEKTGDDMTEIMKISRQSIDDTIARNAMPKSFYFLYLISSMVRHKGAYCICTNVESRNEWMKSYDVFRKIISLKIFSEKNGIVRHSRNHKERNEFRLSFP